MAIFTVTEAREFKYQGQTPLDSETAYPDELIAAAAERITADFARICGVAFEPTTVTDEVFDGPGDGPLLLPHTRVTVVSAAGYRAYGETAWTAFTAGELAALELDSEAGLLYRVGTRWPCGSRRLRVTYTHGYATPPAPIVRAALILAVEELRGSNLSPRQTQQTNEIGTFNLAVPGWRDNQWYGLPIVDAALARYSERGPMVG